MSFFKSLQSNYGDKAMLVARSLSKVGSLLSSTIARKCFLVKCRRFKVTPKFLLNSGTLSNNQCLKRIKQKYDRKIISVLIKDAFETIGNLQRQYDGLIVDLLQILPAEMVDEFVNFEKSKNEKKTKRTEKYHARKLQTLINQQLQGSDQINNIRKHWKNWIQNLTDINIPEAVLNTLALGPKFVLPLTVRQGKSIPELAAFFKIDGLVANFEAKIHFEQESFQTEVRKKTVETIEKFLAGAKGRNRQNKDKKGGEESAFLEEVRRGVDETRRFLHENPEILVVQADKSNKSVIMRAEEYDIKMRNLLNDKDVYARINRDLSNTQQQDNNTMVKGWFEQGFITKQTQEWLETRTGVAPKIYGLVKLHKPDSPLRPIVSCTKSSYYKMSKYLASILSKVVGKTKHAVKDSFQFKEFISQQKVPEGYVLASLDVKSLYTNIPIDLALKAVEKQWQKIKQHTALPKHEFFHALEVCLTSTFFQYKDEFYKQVSGLAMGGPVSGPVADLVMEYVESEVLKKLTCNIAFYKRFVDDSIICFPAIMRDYVVRQFNAFHSRIQVTIEEQINNSINFLDLTIMHNNQKITTKWYQKPTASGRYLNFFSSVPHQWKKNVANNLFQRALTLSDRCHQMECERKARSLLLGNGYPPIFLDKMLKKCRYIVRRSSEERKCAAKFNLDGVIKVPYVRGLGEKLKKCWAPFKLQPVFSGGSSNKSLFSKLKSKVPIEKNSGVVYQINCGDCDRVYIGQTKRYLGDRITSHKYGGERTALAKHANELKHSFDFSNPQILAMEENPRSRLYLEAIHINKCSRAINYRADAHALNAAYKTLFRGPMSGEIT